MTIPHFARYAWENTKSMPFVLRMYCQGSMVVAPPVLFFVAVPLADWTVNGQVMSYAQLWASGAGVTLFLLALLVGIGGWGLAFRVGAARWAWVLAMVVPYILALVVGSKSWAAPLADDVSLWPVAVITAAVYVYLFHFSSVRRYLAGGMTGSNRV